MFSCKGYDGLRLYSAPQSLQCSMPLLWSSSHANMCVCVNCSECTRRERAGYRDVDSAQRRWHRGKGVERKRDFQHARAHYVTTPLRRSSAQRTQAHSYNVYFCYLLHRMAYSVAATSVIAIAERKTLNHYISKV